MAYRTLELTLISAKDLANVNLFSKMEVYAVAMVAGDARSKKKTSVDREGGKNPTWNAKFTFNVMEFDADRTVLHVVIKSERAMGDREVGEVHIPVRELLDGWKTAAASSGGGDEKKAVPDQFVSYQVRRPSGRAKGVLNLSYKFGDPVTISSQPPNAYAGSSIPAYPQPTGSAYPPQSGSAYPPSTGPAYPPPALKNPGEPATSSKISEPVTAYPATNSKVSEPVTAYPPPPNSYPHPPHSQPGYGYPPPPQAGYGYPPPGGYPPQSGYGYGYPPPQQSGYGYGAPPPVVQPQQGRKNKLGGGAGLGLGLLGGALGGMILGDMVSDASSYDSGYDAGFDNGSGYDGGFDGGFGF